MRQGGTPISARALSTAIIIAVGPQAKVLGVALVPAGEATCKQLGRHAACLTLPTVRGLLQHIKQFKVEFPLQGLQLVAEGDLVFATVRVDQDHGTEVGPVPAGSQDADYRRNADAAGDEDSLLDRRIELEGSIRTIKEGARSPPDVPDR
jgi:hypothetical protein